MGNHGFLWRLMMRLLILVLIGVILWVALVGMVYWRETHLPPVGRFDAIIVLGCQVKPDGSLSLQLQMRLEKVLDVWRTRQVPIVVCGGQGSNEPCTEASAMKTWLIDHGVPEGMILCDETSVNTRTNLENARALLGEDADGIVAIVTSDYHVPRALSIAKDAGLNAVGFGGETLGGMHWVRNHFREALSWVKYWAEKYFLRR